MNNFSFFSYFFLGGLFMKKRVIIDKQIQVPTMIGEITAISLEKELSFVDSNNVEGNLYVKGKYKLTEASRLEEDFLL